MPGTTKPRTPAAAAVTVLAAAALAPTAPAATAANCSELPRRSEPVTLNPPTSAPT